MYSETQLNQLVAQGKADILAMVETILTRGTLSAPLQTRFRLALNAEQTPLDIYRTKVMILEENEDILPKIASGDEGFLAAMAQATGRVSRLQDCLSALGRVAMTLEPGSEGAEALAAFKAELGLVGRFAVRMQTAEGGLALLPVAA